MSCDEKTQGRNVDFQDVEVSGERSNALPRTPEVHSTATATAIPNGMSPFLTPEELFHSIQLQEGEHLRGQQQEKKQRKKQQNQQHRQFKSSYVYTDDQQHSFHQKNRVREYDDNGSQCRFYDSQQDHHKINHYEGDEQLRKHHHKSVDQLRRKYYSKNQNSYHGKHHGKHQGKSEHSQHTHQIWHKDRHYPIHEGWYQVRHQNRHQNRHQDRRQGSRHDILQSSHHVRRLGKQHGRRLERYLSRRIGRHDDRQDRPRDVLQGKRHDRRQGIPKSADVTVTNPVTGNNFYTGPNIRRTIGLRHFGNNNTTSDHISESCGFKECDSLSTSHREGYDGGKSESASGSSLSSSPSSVCSSSKSLQQLYSNHLRTALNSFSADQLLRTEDPEIGPKPTQDCTEESYQDKQEKKNKQYHPEDKKRPHTTYSLKMESHSMSWSNHAKYRESSTKRKPSPSPSSFLKIMRGVSCTSVGGDTESLQGNCTTRKESSERVGEKQDNVVSVSDKSMASTIAIDNTCHDFRAQNNCGNNRINMIKTNKNSKPNKKQDTERHHSLAFSSTEEGVTYTDFSPAKNTKNSAKLNSCKNKEMMDMTVKKKQKIDEAFDDEPKSLFSTERKKPAPVNNTNATTTITASACTGAKSQANTCSNVNDTVSRRSDDAGKNPQNDSHNGSIGSTDGGDLRKTPCMPKREPTPPYYFYTDHSLDGDDEPLKPLTQPSRVPNFPVKMHVILNRDDLSNAIMWLPHGRSWRIVDPVEFELKVMPTYFGHSSLASFMRQVNGWGFKRLTRGRDKNSYYHEYFLRGLPYLCKKMIQPGTVPRNKLEKHSASLEPDLAKISEERPLPYRPDPNDIYASALEWISKCIEEGGPKARVPLAYCIASAPVPHPLLPGSGTSEAVLPMTTPTPPVATTAEATTKRIATTVNHGCSVTPSSVAPGKARHLSLCNVADTDNQNDDHIRASRKPPKRNKSDGDSSNVSEWSCSYLPLNNGVNNSATNNHVLNNHSIDQSGPSPITQSIPNVLTIGGTSAARNDSSFHQVNRAQQDHNSILHQLQLFLQNQQIHHHQQPHSYNFQKQQSLHQHQGNQNSEEQNTMIENNILHEEQNQQQIKLLLELMQQQHQHQHYQENPVCQNPSAVIFPSINDLTESSSLIFQRQRMGSEVDINHNAMYSRTVRPPIQNNGAATISQAQIQAIANGMTQTQSMRDLNVDAVATLANIVLQLNSSPSSFS